MNIEKHLERFTEKLNYIGLDQTQTEHVLEYTDALLVELLYEYEAYYNRKVLPDVLETTE